MKKDLLESLSLILEEKIKQLKEASAAQAEDLETEEDEKTMDIRSLGEGKTLTIDFENVSIKFKKISSEYDFWIVIDARDSVQLKNGDVVQFVKANESDSEPGSILKKGKKLKMDIIRKTNIDYLSNPVENWHA